MSEKQQQTQKPPAASINAPDQSLTRNYDDVAPEKTAVSPMEVTADLLKQFSAPNCNRAMIGALVQRALSEVPPDQLVSFKKELRKSGERLKQFSELVFGEIVYHTV